MKPGEIADNTEKKEKQQIIRQINPHFIFNTLATIRIITKVNPDLAYDMIYDFSKYLRVVFKSFTNAGNISFKEEAEHVISYANLEKIRFGDNIMININIGESDFMLPPLSLQPLVENAIIHGLKRGKRKGTVSIRSGQTASEYIVCVEDDGIGFDMGRYSTMIGDERLKDGGLQRVKCRLEQLAGGKLEVKSTVEAGTVITLRIPKDK